MTLERTVFAHRGMPKLAPENTLASFREAAKFASWVELDVDIISDGTPVVMHDTLLDRTTNRSGSMYQLTSADLPNIDAGSWFSQEFLGEQLPTFYEVINALNECGLNANVELKANERGAAESIREVETVIEALQDFKGNLIVSSFSPLLLSEFHRRSPETEIGVLFEAVTIREDWYSIAQLCGASYIHPEDEGLTQAKVELARNKGFGVNVWTVNSPKRAEELFSWGATGVFTDIADVLNS